MDPRSFDETITETNAQYVNPKKSGLTLLKIDFGKLVADEKAFAQLQGTWQTAEARGRGVRVLRVCKTIYRTFRSRIRR